jgi:hypothetical protein
MIPIKKSNPEPKSFDLQWSDKIVLNTGEMLQVVEAFDAVVKVCGRAKGKSEYVRRDEIVRHYPNSSSAYAAGEQR